MAQTLDLREASSDLYLDRVFESLDDIETGDAEALPDFDVRKLVP